MCSVIEEDLTGGVAVLPLQGEAREEGRWEVGAKVVGRRRKANLPILMNFILRRFFSILFDINLFEVLVISSYYCMLIIKFSSKLT